MSTPKSTAAAESEADFLAHGTPLWVNVRALAQALEDPSRHNPIAYLDQQASDDIRILMAADKTTAEGQIIKRLQDVLGARNAEIRTLRQLYCAASAASEMLAAPPAQAEPAAPICACGDRPAAQCDEEWGPNCDLGNNPAHVRVVSDPEAAARVDKALGIVRPAAQEGAQPVAFVSVETLSRMFESLEGLDTEQRGYHWKKGWNAALRQVMDYTHPPQAAQPEPQARQAVALSDEQIADAGRLELAALRKRVKAQRAELRRLNKMDSLLWAGWRWGCDTSQRNQDRAKMIRAFGIDAVLAAERASWAANGLVAPAGSAG